MYSVHVHNYYTVLTKIFAGQKLFPSPVTSALQKYSVE